MSTDNIGGMSQEPPSLLTSVIPLKSPEEGFQDVLTESEEGLQESSLLLKFIEKRASIEADYCQKLELLLQALPSKENTDYPDLWQILSDQLSQVLSSHKGFALALEKNITDSIREELVDQRSKLKLVEKEVKDSFYEYKEKSNELSNTKEAYFKAYQSKDACLEEKEKDYRALSGKFERRRKVQVEIITSAFKRLTELKKTNLQNYVKCFRLYLRFDFNKCLLTLKASEHCCNAGKGFQWNEKFNGVFEYWKSLMTLPSPEYFTDVMHGSLSYLTFGVHLVDHLCILESVIPPFIEHAVKEIDYRGLKTRDIYIVPEQLDSVKDIMIQYEKDSTYFPWSAIDISLIACLIKKYFHDLYVPIFPFEFHSALYEIARVKKEEYRMNKLHQLIHKLPPEHFHTLDFILKHLLKVSLNSHINSASIEVLSNTFAQLLIRPKQSSTEEPEKAFFGAIILTDLLSNYNIIFGSLSVV